MKSVATCVALMALCLGACAQGLPAAQSTSAKGDDATTILRSMAERYGKAASYEDTGSSTVTARSDDGRRASKSHTVFETAFDRKTGGFFLNYEQSYEQFLPPSRGIVWRTGAGGARVFWTVDGEPMSDAKEEQPLDVALGGQTGVSGGIAWNVPSMLLNLGNPWVESVAFQLEGSEDVQKVPCFKLAEHEEHQDVILWIARDDHSLRRQFIRNYYTPEAMSEAEAEILARLPSRPSEEQSAEATPESPRTYGPFVSEETTNYEPVFDRAISATRFNVTPPETAVAPSERPRVPLPPP